MKALNILIVFLFLLFICNQIRSEIIKKPLTTKYAGVYRYGTDSTRSGEITIFPESDSTILFHIELSRGAPSYNLGNLDGRVIIRNDTGTFYSAEDYSPLEGKGCKWSFRFSGERLKIKTIDGNNNCGFGYGVFADASYYRTDPAWPVSHISMEGDTIYFNKDLPDKYQKK